MDDVVPALLESIERDFAASIRANEKITKIRELIDAGTATYEQANDYAIEVGQALVDAFAGNLSSDVLPDGRMYFNIADRILNPTMTNNHSMIAEACTEIQELLNQHAQIALKAVSPPLNQSRIAGLIEKAVAGELFDDISWVFGEPIVNFSQSVVDDAIQANADTHNSVGLTPLVTRTVRADCCDWCREVAGTYRYPNIPDTVYRRHRHCRCTVDYDPGDGKIRRK